MAVSKEVQEFRNATNPGETQEAALLRKVKMHEFLMTGGIALGLDKKGRMQYGPPITAATDPVCPWHDEGCPAWEAIVAGRGHWTRMEAELEALREEAAELIVSGVLLIERDGSLTADASESDQERVGDLLARLAELEDALEFRPRDAKTLRERTPEQFEAERRESKMAKAAQKLANKTPKVYAKAGPKKGGNPWDRAEERDYFKPMVLEPEDDSRNDAVAAFAGEEMPDVIDIEGDEGEEGDE